jgi:hypothetical protein
MASSVSAVSPRWRYGYLILDPPQRVSLKAESVLLIWNWLNVLDYNNLIKRNMTLSSCAKILQTKTLTYLWNMSVDLENH